MSVDRGATVLAHPNPLATPSITLSLSKNAAPVVKPKRSVEEMVGLSLLKLLNNEYGDRYRKGRTIEQAQSTMNEVNPRLARTPSEALVALKSQLKAYMSATTPFDRRRRLQEPIRDWWKSLANDIDADVLAASTIQ